MNGKERIQRVMSGKFPDRVPVWCQLSYGHIAGNAHLPTDATLQDYVEAEVALNERYNFDGIVVSMSMPFIPFDADQPWGGFPAWGESRVLDDIEPGKWSALKTSINDEWAAPYDLAQQRLGAHCHISGWLLDSFTLACTWCGGVQQGLLVMIDAPERFSRLIEYMDQLNLATAHALATRARCDSVCISSPYAGSSFISPDVYQQMVAPSIKRIAIGLREKRVFSYIHNCGFTNDRLELEADTGVDGIECMDPPPLGNVELADAKQRVGNRIFLKGNIDSVNILYRGTDQQVRDEIIRQLRIGKLGGRYILSSACSIAPEVPPERIHWMVALAEEWGRY